MRELNSQPNSTNNKKKLIAELFYKVKYTYKFINTL